MSSFSPLYPVQADPQQARGFGADAPLVLRHRSYPLTLVDTDRVLSTTMYDNDVITPGGDNADINVIRYGTSENAAKISSFTAGNPSVSTNGDIATETATAGLSDVSNLMKIGFYAVGAFLLFKFMKGKFK